MTGYLSSLHFREHLTGPGHPETPSRLDVIDRQIRRNPLFNPLLHLSPRPIGDEWLFKVHQADYIRQLESSIPSDLWIGRSKDRTERLFYLDPDTPVSPLSFQTARLAAGGICRAADEIMQNKIRNAFCAVRPPGHHAGISQAMGFCLINHAAVAARYLQGRYNMERVVIIDWDVHHGNGTQEIFYEDPSVFYFSVHQYPFYPGTGSSGETGRGEGEGFTLNAPLDRGGGDREYFDLFENVLFPRLEVFKPQLIIISAGFDAHKDDPLGQMELSTEGFGRLTSIVKKMAEQFCNGRIVSILEGGYNLQALAESVEKHLSALME